MTLKSALPKLTTEYLSKPLLDWTWMQYT